MIVAELAYGRSVPVWDGEKEGRYCGIGAKPSVFCTKRSQACGLQLGLMGGLDATDGH